MNGTLQKTRKLGVMPALDASGFIESDAKAKTGD
jgi:hypothetical protein